MIFTECPSCDEPQVFGWESGDPTGWFPSKCGKCGAIMWVEAASMGGRTMDHATFKAEIMRVGDDAKVDAAADGAVVQGQMEEADGDPS